jgi:hypothetical protein
MKIFDAYSTTLPLSFTRFIAGWCVRIGATRYHPTASHVSVLLLRT